MKRISLMLFIVGFVVLLAFAKEVKEAVCTPDECKITAIETSWPTKDDPANPGHKIASPPTASGGGEGGITIQGSPSGRNVDAIIAKLTEKLKAKRRQSSDPCAAKGKDCHCIPTEVKTGEWLPQTLTVDFDAPDGHVKATYPYYIRSVITVGVCGDLA